MKVKISKWGNSVGVRLPKRYADELGLRPGTIVDLGRKEADSRSKRHRNERFRTIGLMTFSPKSSRGWFPHPMRIGEFCRRSGR